MQEGRRFGSWQPVPHRLGDSRILRVPQWRPPYPSVSRRGGLLQQIGPFVRSCSGYTPVSGREPPGRPLAWLAQRSGPSHCRRGPSNRRDPLVPERHSDAGLRVGLLRETNQSGEFATSLNRVRPGIGRRRSEPPARRHLGATALTAALRFGEIRSGYNPGMARNEEIVALVKRFQDTGNRLTAKPAYTDEEMSLVDQAQVQRLEALQGLVHHVSIAEAARLLGMTSKGVEDELRIDRSIE
jgi:hypothetical protein